MHTRGMLRRAAVVLGAACAVMGTPACAAAPPAPGAVVTMPRMVVTGVVPGPALWKVSGNGHVMWVLGITSALPKHIRWDSREVDYLIASSQRVLDAPGYYLYMDNGSAHGSDIVAALDAARHLPPGETLQKILPSDLYARWSAAKGKYLHGWRGWGVDRLRPVLAAMKLYDAALDQSDLAATGMVEETVDASASRHRVRRVATTYVLKLRDPEKRLADFTRTAAQGQACLRDTLDTIDRHFPEATALANAWATGDLHALRDSLALEQPDACFSDLSAMWGVQDISGRVREAWLGAARNALTHATQSVAMLPLRDLLTADSYLDALARDGYEVHAPASLAEAAADP